MKNKVRCLFENENVMVFDKPAGLLVIPSPKNEPHTLVSLVNEGVAQSGSHLTYRLHPCHRLDRDTSGVIIFAKGKNNQKMMMDLFEARQIKKKYIALAHGKVHPPKGEMTFATQHFESRRFNSGAKGKKSLTKYRVLEYRKKYCIVEVEPITGRTNQIRIHFSHIGHPLVGERKYAFAKDFSLKFRRTALHSHSLEWVDPKNKNQIAVTSPLAQDMQEFINKFN